MVIIRTNQSICSLLERVFDARIKMDDIVQLEIIKHVLYLNPLVANNVHTVAF